MPPCWTSCLSARLWFQWVDPVSSPPSCLECLPVPSYHSHSRKMTKWENLWRKNHKASSASYNTSAFHLWISYNPLAAVTWANFSVKTYPKLMQLLSSRHLGHLDLPRNSLFLTFLIFLCIFHLQITRFSLQFWIISAFLHLTFLDGNFFFPVISPMFLNFPCIYLCPGKKNYLLSLLEMEVILY